MKKYRILLGAFVASMCLNSCYELDRYPADQISDGIFWQTETHAKQGIMGVYAALREDNAFGMRFAYDCMSDIGVGYDSQGFGPVILGTYSDRHALVEDKWKSLYDGVMRANLVLQKVPGIESMSEELKTQYLAEARFLRALYYFNLVRLFGDVPLIKIQQTAAHDLQVHRAPKEQIYELIIQDLKDAASLLPAQYEQSSDIGRATKGASLGLLAKVYLTLKRYDDTISTIEELETLNVYSLNKKYDWNFDYSRENGPESLFEVQYEKDVTTYAEFDILGQGAWHNDYLAPLAPIAIGGRWGNFGWFAVYQEFVDSYEPGDLRKKVSVWCQGDQYKGWSYDPSCSQTGHNVKKFLCEDIGQDRAMDSPLNFPVLRYADVLLMYAEALNETGHTKEACAPATSYEEGGPLNRVRARAGLPNVDTEDQAELREIIRHERRMELAFEGGHRWFDLIRYDENGEYAKKFFHSIGKTNFTTPKHLLLPVPMDDIDANPNLRPNNPGY